MGMVKVSVTHRKKVNNWLKRAGLRGFRRLQFAYLLLTRSVSGLLLSLNWWDVVDEHFVVGGALMFDDLQRLRRQGVRAIVNLSAERPDNQQQLQAAEMDYLWLPVLDTFAPTVEQIHTGLQWIAPRVQAGHTVYIHCAAGRGRSTTLLACWYIATQNMSVAQVVPFLKHHRPQTALTRWQVRRLEEFAAQYHTGGMASP